jgi:hypothetical protein
VGRGEGCLMAGWIKLHRGWRDCEAFTRSAFSDQEAWLWLLENAAWAPMHRVAGKGNVIAVERGQIHSSERALATSWRWDRKRVKRFLTRLEKCKMCHLQWDRSGVLITICNYEKYQEIGANSGTNQGTDAGPTEDQPGTTQEEGKEGLEGKEEKNEGARYAFFGRVIRLIPRDLENWRRTFYAVPDIMAELSALDLWLEDQSEAKRKKWFHTAFGALNRKHQEILERRQEPPPGEARMTVPC